MQTASLVLATAGNSSVGALILDLIAAIVIFVALVRIVAAPRELWAHGRVSKTAWIIAALWFTPYFGALLVPAGALVAIWKTHSLSRRPKPQPLSIPYAEGAALPEIDAEENDR